MAISNSLLLKEMRGTIGKQIVIKQYGDKTVVTKYPDMRRVKPSPLQKMKRSVFADAVKYAQAINRNREEKDIYLQKVNKGQSVYHFALKEYLDKNKNGE